MTRPALSTPGSVARRYELLIFDWDGTLSDSQKQIISAMQAAIGGLNLPPRTDQEIGELIGLGLTEGMRLLYPEKNQGELSRLLDGYRFRASHMINSAPLFDGVAPTLGDLRDAGYRLAVATGRSRSGFDRSLMAHRYLASLLEVTRCADESAGKPNPLMLHQILEAAAVGPERALMIGDTEYDMAMAAAANVPALAVCSGVHSVERLRRSGASAVISEVKALPVWLGLR